MMLYTQPAQPLLTRPHAGQVLISPHYYLHSTLGQTFKWAPALPHTGGNSQHLSSRLQMHACAGLDGCMPSCCHAALSSSADLLHRLSAGAEQRRDHPCALTLGLCIRSYTGVGLFTKMQTSFGSLTTATGYNGHQFPLAFGETGSFYTAVSSRTVKSLYSHALDDQTTLRH